MTSEHGLRNDAYENDPAPGIIDMIKNPVGAIFSEDDGPVGKDHVVAFHIPPAKNALDGLQDTMAAISGKSAFSVGAAAKESVAAMRARTFYFECESADQATELAAVLNGNYRASISGTKGRDQVVKDLESYFGGAGVDVSKVDIGATIDKLYTMPTSADAAAAAMAGGAQATPMGAAGGIPAAAAMGAAPTQAMPGLGTMM